MRVEVREGQRDNSKGRGGEEGEEGEEGGGGGERERRRGKGEEVKK